ncbi:hypothetical protein A3K64_03340 [Candidatus Micrarchaeota archaeon RBG_16_36_9]|nr:MAG: hypothetical protein A3K64_03340 [Candidatus Micrarchaeota archaeon RBG_16_36_9]
MEERNMSFLESVKDGSILDKVIEYEKISGLSNGQRKAFDIVIYLNKQCRFPRIKDVNKYAKTIKSYIHLNPLVSMGLLFDPTMPQFVDVFGEEKNKRVMLPETIDYATWYDLNSTSGHKKGGSRTWKEKIEDSRNTSYSRYYIAPTSKDGKPTFLRAFNFLDY